MKILFVLSEWSGGGIATYYRNLIPVLRVQGIDVSVVVAQTALPNNSETVDFPIFFLDTNLKKEVASRFNHLQLHPLLQEGLTSAYTLYEQMHKGEGFDLVEISDYPLLFAPWLLEGTPTQVLVQLHGSLGQIELQERRVGQYAQTAVLQHFEESLLRSADHLASPSQQNSAYWRQKTGRSVSTLMPLYTTKTPHEIEGTSAALVLGRVQTWKGPELLCQAIELLGAEPPTVEWVGGDNFYREYATSMSGYLANKYPVWGERIHYLGVLPYAQAQEKIQQAAFLIVPSNWDTFNYTVVEAISLGKVILCSDGAGVVEHINHGQTGFVFPAGDAQALAKLIKKVNALSTIEKKEIGQRAMAYYQQHFAAPEEGLKRATWYRSLMAQSKQFTTNLELDWYRTWIKNEDIGSEIGITLAQIPIKQLLLHIRDRFLKRLNRRK